MRSPFSWPDHQGISTFVDAARLEGAGRTGGAACAGRETMGAGAGRATGSGAWKPDRAGIAMGRRLANSGSSAMRGAGREIIGIGARKSGRAGVASGRGSANPVSAIAWVGATAGTGVRLNARLPMRLTGACTKSCANRADGSAWRLAKRSIGRAGSTSDGFAPREPGGTGGWSGVSTGRGEPDATGSWPSW